jgi:hypothetical protein
MTLSISINIGNVVKNSMSSYNLFGIFAIHSPESCPLNNTKNKEVFKDL